MKKALAAIAAAGLLTLTACGSTDTTPPTTTAGAGTTSATQDQGGDHNDADVRFARMMIPHHAQAVEMSEILLAKDGIDERVRGLAEQIKAAQAPEIEQLTTWLNAWGAGAMPMHSESMPMNPGSMPMNPGSMPMDPGSMPGTDMPMPGGQMDGMMSAQDMQALSEAQGTEAARLFLTQMTVHHEGAITMAQQELDTGRNPDAVALAQSIIDTQQREITTMQELLSTL
jgi:uncharacterized protein (DUF305 family)